MHHSITLGWSADLFVGAPGRVYPLPDLNLEKRLVGVFMAPLEVLLLLAPFHSVEITIIAMLLLEIGAVRAIFVAVPRMVVASISIVIAFFGMVPVSSGYDRTDKRGAQHQRAQD
jgi:hypothetical protein